MKKMVKRTIDYFVYRLMVEHRKMGVSSEESMDIFNYHGLSVLVDNKSHCDNAIRYTGIFEKEQMDFFSFLWEKGDIKNKFFLDVGAHWGIYALRAWKSNLFDKIVAFEADRYNYSQLMAQVFLNKAIEINAVNKAVSNTNGIVCVENSIQKPYNRGNIGLVGSNKPSSGNPDNDEPIDDVYEVECITLDSFFKPELSDSIIFIKIDVEGHESSVLEGMKNMIKNNQVVMQVEAFPHTEKQLYEFINANDLYLLHKIHVDHYITNIPDLLHK